MQDCVFCKIRSGREQFYLIYENDQYMAFLNIRPRTKGDTLVIPKTHYRWVDEVPQIGEYFEFAGKIARAAKRALSADWVQFLTIGEEVAHAHIHVIPRYIGDEHGAVVNLGRIQRFTHEEMQRIAGKIKREIDEQV